jgi:hypothetical protein
LPGGLCLSRHAYVAHSSEARQLGASGCAGRDNYGVSKLFDGSGNIRGRPLSFTLRVILGERRERLYRVYCRNLVGKPLSACLEALADLFEK